jgi:hypothetical protein
MVAVSAWFESFPLRAGRVVRVVELVLSSPKRVKGSSDKEWRMITMP